MIRFLQRHPGVVRDYNVVELGAGTGGVGLTAAQLGAARVLLTDQHTELIAANIHENGLGNNADVAQVDWTNMTTWEAARRAGPWDVLIASDVFFWCGFPWPDSQSLVQRKIYCSQKICRGKLTTGRSSSHPLSH